MEQVNDTTSKHGNVKRKPGVSPNKTTMVAMKRSALDDITNGKAKGLGGLGLGPNNKNNKTTGPHGNGHGPASKATTGNNVNTISTKPEIPPQPQPSDCVRVTRSMSKNLSLTFKNKSGAVETKVDLPEGVSDFDAECMDDPMQLGEYASEIFAYYMSREKKVTVEKYLEKQPYLNRNMRAILVSWLVEVQESFELHHETLYLAVKLVDMFLTKALVRRDKLQLVGTTSIYIASKFDERRTPVIHYFQSICNDAYTVDQILSTEREILKALNFDIGVSLSCRFLERYSQVSKLCMDTLTLARFILETSLMEYEFVDVPGSLIASASLLLALKLKEKAQEQPWSSTLVHYSGYKVEELFDLAHRLFEILKHPQLKQIKLKYSTQEFLGVGKLTLPKNLLF